ncbi:hypothetical protein LguiB_016243 [Lonicera macranthoides]
MAIIKHLSNNSSIVRFREACEDENTGHLVMELCEGGAFIGCALEWSVVTIRAQENSRFYGSQSLIASDILLGSLPRPSAAAILYRALADLYQKF